MTRDPIDCRGLEVRGEVLPQAGRVRLYLELRDTAKDWAKAETQLNSQPYFVWRRQVVPAPQGEGEGACTLRR